MHIEKYTRGQVVGILSHDCRACDRHKNENIDVSRSHLNYDLCQSQGTPIQRYNERFAEVKCLNRANVNTRVSCVFTAPVSFTGKAENLFSAVYDFLSDRYCQDERNVITAMVHNDEITPHMHFCFIPVVDGRVNAKALINRADLQTLHQDLQRHLHGLGFAVDVLNGATAEGNKTVKQLKIESLNKEIEATKARLDNTKTALSAVETAYSAEKAYTDACREASEASKVVPSYATVHRGILGRPDTITMPLEQYKNTVITANQMDAVQRAQQRLDNGIQRTLHFAEAQEATAKKLQSENETLRRENASLKASLLETWQKVNKVLDRLGERFRSVFRHEWERADKAEEHKKNDNEFSI